jgi:hypothetical protein
MGDEDNESVDQRDEEADGGLTSGTYDGGVYTDPDTGEKIDFNDLFSPTGGNTDFGKSLGSLKNLLTGKGSYGMAGQLAGLGGIGALLNKMMGGGGGGPSGYQGSIPTYTASREQYAIPPSGSQSAYKPPQFEMPNYGSNDTMARMGSSPQRMAGIGALASSMARPNSQTPAQPAARRPGSGGVTYFSPMQYLKPGEAPAVTNTQPTAQPPTQSYAPAPFERDPAPENIGIGDFMRRQTNPTIVPEYARGGITTLGGYSDGGRLLRGPGDGVSDSIPATIGNNQPARLADGEFVVPARIVSELGNGSTEAGARKLYAMMDRIKKTRAKAKNIAANTKADKHLPA